MKYVELYILGAIIALIQTIAGVWIKSSFVRKSEIYAKSGKPHYQFREDSIASQAMVEGALGEIRRDLKAHGEALARIEGKLNVKE